MIDSIAKIIETAKTEKRNTISVAGAHDSNVMQAVIMAHRQGIIDAILVGHPEEITAMLKESGEDLTHYTIVPADSLLDCANTAVELCAQGKADFLMKGMSNTKDLMHAVLKKENHLRTGHLCAHYMFYQAPNHPRLIVMSDGGVNPFPDLKKKAEILETAAKAFQAFGYTKINAACICAAEYVNESVQSNLDAVALSEMTERWAPYGMNVYGPTALDLAISKEACEHKNYHIPGAGEADILLMPNYEVGNAMWKASTIYGGVKGAGVILGARIPLVVTSRSDSPECKMSSIALASILSSRMEFD